VRLRVCSEGALYANLILKKVREAAAKRVCARSHAVAARPRLHPHHTHHGHAVFLPPSLVQGVIGDAK
jgi:hypothetical protein